MNTTYQSSAPAALEVLMRKTRIAGTDLQARPMNAMATKDAAAGTTRSKPVRILCVDDHAILIEGLRAQFAISGQIEVVGRLSDASTLLDAIKTLRPDAVLLDIEMPGPDAFEMADRVRQNYPEVRVMVLSAHVRTAYINASFAAGACAYFSKSDDLSDIVNGILDVMQSHTGKFLLGPKIRELCRPPMSGQGVLRGGSQTTEDRAIPMTLLDSLTVREAEILRLIGKGLSRTQIAAQLCRSAKTVDGHQERMMKKLGIESRSDLMRFAIREGLAQA